MGWRGAQAANDVNEQRGGVVCGHLGVLQQPLEEGGLVEPCCLRWLLLSGVEGSVHLAFFTVAQQRVQQIANLPPPLSQPLHHNRQLGGHRATLHLMFHDQFADSAVQGLEQVKA